MRTILCELIIATITSSDANTFLVLSINRYDFYWSTLRPRLTSLQYQEALVDTEEEYYEEEGTYEEGDVAEEQQYEEEL